MDFLGWRSCLRAVFFARLLRCLLPALAASSCGHAVRSPLPVVVVTTGKQGGLQGFTDGRYCFLQVEFHLRQLERQIVPTDTTKMSLWTLEQDESFYKDRKRGSLSNILRTELG